MRISDCSSDVCSSGLGIRRRFAIADEVARVVAGHHVLFETAPEGVVFRLQSPAANFSRPGRQATTTGTSSQSGSAPKGQVSQGGSGGITNVRQAHHRSEEHTSELQSLMRISYAVFCLKKKKY